MTKQEYLTKHTGNGDVARKDLDAVIEQAIADNEARKGMLCCDYCGCHPDIIFKTHKGNLCEKCNGIG